jgi:hypothetical protein
MDVTQQWTATRQLQCHCCVPRRMYRGYCPGVGAGIEPGSRLVTGCLLRQNDSFVQQWSLLGV